MVDDFYQDPHKAIDYALSLDFNVRHHFPGLRTKPSLTKEVKDSLQEILLSPGGLVEEWAWPHPLASNEISGEFQLNTIRDRSWVHIDDKPNWAGVIYLTPHAPPHTGTGIFRHKETGYFQKPEDQQLHNTIMRDAQDYTKGDVMDIVSNVFNRLVLYRADMYHSALSYFGDSKEDGRIIQLFFLKTEY